MIVTLLFCFTLDKHLTWYENFEQGEKYFKERKFELAIEYFEAAATERPVPKQNAFTRAVQTIEYKPYYYLALAYEHLDQHEKAYIMAKKALNGEVVRNNSSYMNDLAHIIEARLTIIAQKNQEFETQQEELTKRLEFFQFLSVQDFEKAEKLLQTFNPDQKDQLEDVLIRQKDVHSRRLQMEGLITRYQDALEAFIRDEKKIAARALLDSMVPILTPELVEYFNQQIEAIPTPSEPETVQPAETVSNQEITSLIENLTHERNQLESLLARDQKEISNLSDRIEVLSKQSSLVQTVIPPEINFSVQYAGRSILLTGHLLVPDGFKKAEIIVADQKRSLAPNDKEERRTFAFEEHFHSLAYGAGQIQISVVDLSGHSVTQTADFFILKPWYFKPRFLLGCAVLAFSFMAFFFLRKTYRKRQALLQHFNPYIAGVPVREKDMFFGREDLLMRVEKLVQNNCLMIFGQRRIGKTSLLHQLHDRLRSSENPKVKFFPVFIDLQGVQENDLFHVILGEIIAAYPDLEHELPFCFKHEETNYSSRQFSKDLKMLIEHLQSKNKKHIHIVLLMDEVDAINDYSEKTNQKLRGIFMKTFSDHLSSIMAGIHLKKHWESSGSPWYNFFEEIPMTHISHEAARDLITVPVAGIFSYDEPAIDMIIHETGCQPFLIQKICVSLINQQLETKKGAKRRFQILREDVENVLEGMKSEKKVIEGVQNS